MRRSRARIGRLGSASTCAVAAAAAYTLASPPRDLALVAWLVAPLLLLPVAQVRPRLAWLPGLVFGFASALGVTTWALAAAASYFAIGRVAAAGFAALVWLVYGGLPYAALTLGYATLARRVRPAWHPLAGAWLWVVVEVARTRLPAALPWWLLSHSQWQSSLVLQVADLGGGYAVTFTVAYVGLALAEAVRSARAGAGHALRVAAPALALLALVLAYGHVRRAALQTGVATRRVAVVQGRGSGGAWERGAVERSLASYTRLTAGIAGAASPDLALVVWPENAVDFYLEQDPMLLARLRAVTARRGSALLLGAPRLAAPGVAHNSAHLFGADGIARGTYDKQLLVPLAEGSLLPVADAVAAEPAYRGGTRHGPLASGDLSLGVMICFEVLFPQLVGSAVADGANLLVNVSNDGWLDDGTGAAPHQHFAGAVLRAVETRRALVRASAGGVSGFVDADGTVHDVVPWGETGAATGLVALRDGRTPYVRYGDTWIVVLGVLLGIAAWRDRRTERA